MAGRMGAIKVRIWKLRNNIAILKKASSLAMGVDKSGSRILSKSRPLPVDPQQQPKVVKPLSTPRDFRREAQPKQSNAVARVTTTHTRRIGTKNSIKIPN
jgi:hypothetical protein